MAGPARPHPRWASHRQDTTYFPAIVSPSAEPAQRFRMKPPALSIISGVAPGTSGTGWLLRGLLREIYQDKLPVYILHKAERRSSSGFRVLYPGNLQARLCHAWSRFSFPRKALAASAKARRLLLLHPQTMGHDLFARIVESRRFTWTYVLDSYFFCKSGYNHLPAESLPCLRCLGSNGEASVAQGCHDSFAAGPFTPSLREWVRKGKLGLVAQCKTQAGLLSAHFGHDTKVSIVPLHVPDIDPDHFAPTPRSRPLAVFHASSHPAKGLGVVLALARQMPEWDFLLPFRLRELERVAGFAPTSLPNLIVRPMTWETGLAEAVAKADAVLCPSLWSAPVEGALLKSLAANGVVLAYPHETSFASELPHGSFIPLWPNRVSEAAAELRAIHCDPSARHRLRADAAAFVTAYAGRSRRMASALLAACD